MSEKTLGQIGYETYAAAQPAGLSSIDGAQLPVWDDVTPGIKRRWEAAGEAIAVADQMSRSQENKPPS